MEKDEKGVSGGLKNWILSQIREKGPVPFSQFMEWCLYHPRGGYYQSGRTRIGKAGDYYTNPCVHPLFGGMIAKQLTQMAEILGAETFEVVEMGGAKGYLCQDILQWSKEKEPLFYRQIKYTLLETALPFLEEQKERLQAWEKEGKVLWMDPEEFAGGRIQQAGCFLSNELVDAFPVHRVVFDQGRLKEIYVSQEDGQLEEKWGEISDPRIADYVESMGILLEEGQKAEVNLKSLEWMEKINQSLKKGFVLTIDYGYPSEELYAPHRSEGTLLCYYQNQTSYHPYERVGEQDMTSHVNFTSLIRKGEEIGLRFTGLVPQYRFLMGVGILQEMESLAGGLSETEGLRLRLSLKHLIEPEAGMGEVFKVLIQHKGIDQPQLDGLRDLHAIY
jgi:SAM-dependent MidA family methyltransferase